MAQMILYPNNKHQVFSTFGVSGAWWAQEVGGWNETDEKSGIPKNERIAQLLFDEKEGLGIKCYRYNLGGGSKFSGNGRYDNEQRKTESFDTDDYNYDWSRDKNAVEMMKLVREDSPAELNDEQPEFLAGGGCGDALPEGERRRRRAGGGRSAGVHRRRAGTRRSAVDGAHGRDL